MPFIASPYHASLYLPAWIFALPDTELAIRLWWTFHFTLAAVSCYALARYWRMEVAPALFAAVSFAFGTFMMAWLEFTLAMAWGIVALLMVSRIIDRTAEVVAQAKEKEAPLQLGSIFLSNSGSIAGLAVSLGLLLLATGEFFYYTSLLLASYTLARGAWHGSWKAFGLSLLFLALAGMLILALAAPQLIPTFEMMRFSIRSGEVDPAFHMTSEHPRHWLTLLLPYLYGRPGYPNSYWPATIYEFAGGTWYIGILPLIGVFFGWLRPKAAALDPAARERRFLVWFLTAVVVAGLIMAAGKYTPVYGFLHHWLPGMGHLRFPTKFHFFTAFALAMLGALGFQSLLVPGDEREARNRVRLWWGAAGLFGIFLLGFLMCLFNASFLPWLMAHPSTPSVQQVDAIFGDYLWAAGFTVAGLALFGMLVFRRGSQKWVQAGVVAVAFLNLCAISRQVQPTGPAGIYTRRPEALLARMGKDALYRHWSVYADAQQYIYGDNRADIWEWAVDSAATSQLQLEGVASLIPQGLYLSRYVQFFRAIPSLPPPIGEKFADMLSMRYIISGAPFQEIYWNNAPRDIHVTERPSCLPRAFVVSQWKVVQGEHPVLSAIADAQFDPHREAIVEPLAGATVPPSSAMVPLHLQGRAGEVRTFVDRSNSVTLEAEVKSRSLLVLNDTWYPGWTVKVDGVAQPIFQTNYLFRGVFLEPGAHRVEFVFSPTHFAVALWICALAVLGCGALAWAGRSTPRGPAVS